jgi:predicted TIM-barrel fold metal-dependent hydrolase
MMPMPRFDLHQHLWPESLIGALASRRSAPCLRCDASGRWRLELSGEPVCDVELADHDPQRRAALAQRDGVDVVAIVLSSPLGIEALPAAEAAPLLAAFNAGVLELGAPFVLWGAVGLERPTTAAVDALLDSGAVGISVPAGALGGSYGIARLEPVLARLGERGAPLLVHPGPAAWSRTAVEPIAPMWWPALTRYVNDMNQAWHAFAAWGRRKHPRLRVVWTMLAGGAPLHAERLTRRGGPAAAVRDPLSFYDVSSSGPRTLESALRDIGRDRLVHGSDRPVVEPLDLSQLEPDVAIALLEHNPQQALAPLAVAA